MRELYCEIYLENEEQTGRLKQDLKEERQNRKRCESRVEHMEEEVSDLRHEKESLEKVRGGRGGLRGGCILEVRGTWTT